MPLILKGGLKVIKGITRNGRARSVLLCCTSAATIVGVCSASTAFAQEGEAAAQTEEIIVTGSRDPRATASSSPSPITVLGAEQLQGTGQPDLRDSLVRLSPSITRVSQTQTNANNIDKLNLRGLSSNHTLILLNGKRRHPTAAINDTAGIEDGTAPVDVGMFPSSAIGRAEVLLDGASAQYGSDAIAGVINLILNNSDHGLTFTTNNGQYYEGDGFTSNSNFNAGMKLGDSGFLNVSAEYRHQEHTNRGRLDDRCGCDKNRFFGNPSQDRFSVSYNAGIDLSDAVQAYSFATFAHKRGTSFANYRTPDRLPQVFPNGFSPAITGREDDFGFTLGLKGTTGGWDWDLTGSYGKDHIDFRVKDTVNLLLFQDTGRTPTEVYSMGFGSSQLTFEADVRRRIDIGLAEPINLAFGAQYRRDTYAIEPGEPDAYYGAGTQGQQGLNPASAVDANRNVKAAYIDIATRPFANFQANFAGRYEKYSDAGSALTGKASLRYDFSPAVALRGTLSNGFRGPIMPETYFTAIGVSPSGADGIVAVNSPAARFLGAQPLKPEKSTNYSLGLVIRPVEKMTISIDAYQINLRNRIVRGGTYNGPTAIAALALIGVGINPGADPNAVSAGYYSNGVDSRTRGLDIVFNYRTDLGDSTIDWDLAANFNNTKVTRVANDLNNRPLLNAQGVAFLESSFPRAKVIFGGVLNAGRFDLNLHETFWGPTKTLRQFVVGPDAFSNTVYYTQKNHSKWQTDIAVGYQMTDSVKLTVGANNLFDARPTEIPTFTAFASVPRYDYDMQQIGINGGFYYATLKVSF